MEINERVMSVFVIRCDQSLSDGFFLRRVTIPLTFILQLMNKVTVGSTVPNRIVIIRHPLGGCGSKGGCKPKS